MLNDSVTNFIKSFTEQNNLSDIELIFVIGDCRENYSEIRNKIENVLGSDFTLLQDKVEGSGPSRCWCIGLKAAKGAFVSFIATDTVVDKGWLSVLLSKLRLQKRGSCLVGNIAGTESKDYLSVIEKAIDQRRFDSVIVDFRNFIGDRELLLNILNKYFSGKYFSDVELDFVLKSQLKIVPIRVPELMIYNRYPDTLSASVQRKFKHGIGYGRICKIFIDKFRSIRTYGLYEFFIATGILCSETWHAKLSYDNIIILAFLNMIFLSGMFFGVVLPSIFTRKYYRFHFDE